MRHLSFPSASLGYLTLRLLGAPPLVLLSNLKEIKQVFTAPADVLHPGEVTTQLHPRWSVTEAAVLRGRTAPTRLGQPEPGPR